MHTSSHIQTNVLLQFPNKAQPYRMPENSTVHTEAWRSGVPALLGVEEVLLPLWVLCPLVWGRLLAATEARLVLFMAEVRVARAAANAAIATTQKKKTNKNNKSTNCQYKQINYKQADIHCQ